MLPFVSSKGTNVKISRSIWLDWYDGPVSGYVECPITKKLFHFQHTKDVMSSISFIRKYDAKRVRNLDMENLIEFFERLQQPDFPIWFVSIPHTEFPENFIQVESAWNSNIDETEVLDIDWDLDENVIVNVTS